MLVFVEKPMTRVYYLCAQSSQRQCVRSIRLLIHVKVWRSNEAFGESQILSFGLM
jgi:hypothetical protein